MPFGAQNPAIEAAMLRAPSERDMVQALPTELVQSCFTLLDFRTRISVSHVSRAWRAVALNDGFLWNKAPAPHTGFRRGPEMLHIPLARSDPLPFSFSWEPPFPRVCLPSSMADIICRNMRRMQALDIKDLSIGDRQRLFRHPAPLLQIFRSEDTKGSPMHARLWPNLQELRIASLPFPHGRQIFAAVRILCCWDIDSFSRGSTLLFQAFPALKTLRVRHIMTENLDCLLNPPASMDEFSLGAMSAFEIDYRPLLDSCRALRVQRLRLHMARESAGIVELFTATTRGQWRMRVDGGTLAELREDEQDRTWIFTSDARISFAREPRLAACMSRMESLTGSTALLVELHNLDAWSRSLPALRTVTLHFPQQGNTSDSIPIPLSTAPIHMPLLNSLTLWLDGMPGEIKQLIETRLPTLLPAILERAPHMTIEVPDLRNVNGCDLAPLTAIAEGVQVIMHSQGKTMYYDPRDDFA